MAGKMKVCCARYESKLTMDRAALQRTARQAAVNEQLGRPTAKLKATVLELKALIVEDQVNADKHDAEHRAGRLP